MTNEQIAVEISTIKESLKSAHKRIDKTDDLTAHIHQLSVNVEKLAMQIAHQNQQSIRVEEAIDSIDSRLKEQGERIGRMETAPAKRWEGMITQIIGLIIAAVMGAIISGIL